MRNAGLFTATDNQMKRPKDQVPPQAVSINNALMNSPCTASHRL
jgi:hypothetical protein